MAIRARFIQLVIIPATCVLGARLAAQVVATPGPAPAARPMATKNGVSFVAPVTGTLYLKCIGGSAGAMSQFGIGSSPSTFVSYLSALPTACPTPEVAARDVVAGQSVPFALQTWWLDQSYWAFSTGNDFGSHVAFTDVNNRLGWGGEVLETVGTNRWVLHLNDAAHFTVSPDEAENLMIQIRLQPRGEAAPAAAPSTPAPRPTIPLTPVRDALHRATNALQHAANQSCPVVKAIEDIAAANRDLNGAVTFFNAHRDTAVPPVSAETRPDFTAPPRPAPQRNEMLEGALGDLRVAFDALAMSPGGDLGGFRSKINADIATAASDLLTAIKAANAAFLDNRRDLPPCGG